MNKPAGKKTKVKCPSTKYAEESVKDDFILNEHINGVVNGVGPEDNFDEKNKKNQKHLNEDNCQAYKEKTMNGLDSDSLDSSKDIKHTKKKKTKLKETTEHLSDIDRKDLSDMDLNKSKNLLDKESDLNKLSYSESLASCSQIDPVLPSIDSGCSTKEILDVVESLVSMQLENKTEETGQIEDDTPVQFMQYESELQMPMIMKIIQKDLSEPYSIYTYRYFIHNWPKLCFLVSKEGYIF